MNTDEEKSNVKELFNPLKQPYKLICEGVKIIINMVAPKTQFAI